MPVIPATQEAEAGELPEPRGRRLRRAEITPLHSSLGNKSKTPSQKKKRKKVLRKKGIMPRPFKKRRKRSVSYVHQLPFLSNISWIMKSFPTTNDFVYVYIYVHTYTLHVHTYTHTPIQIHRSLPFSYFSLSLSLL